MARKAVIEAIKELDSAWFPLYDYPEGAVRAAWNLVRVRALREDDPGEPVEVAAHRETATAALASARRDADGWIPGADAFAVLEAYGIRCAAVRAEADVESAVEAARELGGAVALKLDGPAFLHKTDVGGVKLGLVGDEAVRAAGGQLAEIAGTTSPGRPWRFLVQRMAEPGTELVMGVRSDPVFGPLLAVGLGGIHVEILKDVRFGLVPTTPVLARRMVERLRAYPILQGARGAPSADLDAIVDALLRLAALVEDHPEIAEVEMNPVIARP